MAPKLALTRCGRYRFKVFVQYISTLSSFKAGNWQEHEVQVIPGPIIAKIDSLDRIVLVEESLTLSAANSTDSDAPNDGARSLAFKWGCTHPARDKKSARTACTFNGIDASAFTSITSPTLELKPNVLLADRLYDFSVTVSSNPSTSNGACYSEIRSDSTSVRVTTTSQSTPKLRMALCRDATCSKQQEQQSPKVMVNYGVKKFFRAWSRSSIRPMYRWCRQQMDIRFGRGRSTDKEIDKSTPHAFECLRNTGARS
jgi:hypothetical protein